MSINLRKAATLQEQIRQAISDINLDTELSNELSVDKTSTA